LGGELVGVLDVWMDASVATRRCTMFDTLDSVLAFLLLEPLELLEGREQCPRFVAHQSNMSLAASDGGLECEPPFSDPIRLHALPLEYPIAGRGGRHGRRAPRELQPDLPPS